MRLGSERDLQAGCANMQHLMANRFRNMLSLLIDRLHNMLHLLTDSLRNMSLQRPSKCSTPGVCRSCWEPAKPQTA